MNAAPLFLETARTAHVRDIRRVDARVYPRPWSESLWSRELARPSSEACYVAASQGGHHVGHAGLMVQAGDGHVVTLAVDPARQRSGVASRLLAVLAARAVRLGLDALTLEVRPSNDAARALYRRFGFAPAGIRSGYYADDGEDALVMWAHGVTEPAFVDRIERLHAGLRHANVHPGLTALIELPIGQDVRS
ncbi:MAG: ribosomal protein S18-alanine N-acetyltransferase [Acidimicrobiia bacterium]|nr:ribosomal protein S18-alanine N-acetyltransferase [Acidimicrobiia bacterium]